MMRKYWYMMSLEINLDSTVVVFDLDDTLYFEADYVDSGIRYVCDRLQKLYGRNPYMLIMQARQNGRSDWITEVCNYIDLPLAAKDSLLWMYRLHVPDIHLSPACEEVINHIRARARSVAVLTDGRSITQRLKLHALGLKDWPMFISEDYGVEKPSLERFRAIEEEFPAERYIYIGDNVKKDFLGCNKLGWISIGIRGGTRNVYSQVTDGFPVEALPKYWINNWNELLELLC